MRYISDLFIKRSIGKDTAQRTSNWFLAISTNYDSCSTCPLEAGMSADDARRKSGGTPLQSDSDSCEEKVHDETLNLPRAAGKPAEPLSGLV